MTETLYKWLLEDGTTPMQRVKWPCALGEWTTDEKPVLCESGWHGVEAKDVLEHLPKVSRTPTLWIVETRGDVVRGDDKFACTSMRLVRPVGPATTNVLVKFALVCAESSLTNFEKFFPNDRRVRDCIDVTWRFTRGEATAQEVQVSGSAAAAASAAAQAVAAASAASAAVAAAASAASAEAAAASAAAAAAAAVAAAASAASAAAAAAWSAAWSAAEAAAAAWSSAWSTAEAAAAAWSAASVASAVAQAVAAASAARSDYKAESSRLLIHMIEEAAK